jgi:hypothetical protein
LMRDFSETGSQLRAPKRRRGSGYPKRPQFFFHRYVRLLGKSCTANEIAADGCWLQTIVAATEDSKRYLAAPTFFNEQLAPLCGWSVDKLARVRGKCIELDYLHYEPGGKGVAGIYWVLLPERIGCLQDAGPLGEHESDFLPQIAEGNAERTATQPSDKVGDNRETSTELPYLAPSLIPPPPPRVDPVANRPVRSNGSDARWEAVEAELAEIGLADTAGTVRTARERDYSTTQVSTLIAHWKSRPQAWHPGAIAWRIAHSPPTRPCDTGWPSPRDTPQAARSKPDMELHRLQAKYGTDWSRFNAKDRVALAKRAGVNVPNIEERSLAEIGAELRLKLLREMAG